MKFIVYVLHMGSQTVSLPRWQNTVDVISDGIWGIVFN